MNKPQHVDAIGIWKIFFKATAVLILIVLGSLCPPTAERIYAEKFSDLNPFIEDRDALLIADPHGRIIFSKNADVPLVPASTLKVLTALVAIHYLGKDYRFFTEFYKDDHFNLKIKGYGDPLLVSETLAEITRDMIAELGNRNLEFHDLVLDDSYFKTPLSIPGITSSSNPYDAPNGALCVNFNTVNFKRNSNGVYVSAEPQTPLLPFILTKIKTTHMNHGRIILSAKKDEITLYAGHLFLYFLNKEGVQFNGKIRLGPVHKKVDKLIYRHVSGLPLTEIISKLLEYSNNFIANQLLITTGAKVYGPPGTLKKGVTCALTYARHILKMDTIQMVEGSGISRRNRISANNFYTILKAFEPYHRLMQQTEETYYKTGTLQNVKARVGYIKNKDGKLYCFVLLMNTPGKSPKPIMDILLRHLN